MCPHECPGLSDTYGDEFEALNTKYEKEGKYRMIVPAQKLWFVILEVQTETGTPYILYKDACNRKRNQKNLGTIRCSNLCTEIVEYTAPDEIAVCNLALTAVNKFAKVKRETLTLSLGEIKEVKSCSFDLKYVAKVITRNLSKVIDRNYYPCEEAKRSNMRHSPIGIGIQG